MGTDHAAGQRRTSHGLYADIRGDAGAPALLFLHGGPGQGCHDFMAIQGDLLSRSIRLTSHEQREAFRSAPRGQVLEVPAAGHFVHADDPLQYASAVSDFVRVAAGDLSGTGTGPVPATGL